MENRCPSVEVLNTVRKRKRKWVKRNLEKARTVEKSKTEEGTEVEEAKEIKF